MVFSLASADRCGQAYFATDGLPLILAISLTSMPIADFWQKPFQKIALGSRHDKADYDLASDKPAYFMIESLLHN